MFFLDVPIKIYSKRFPELQTIGISLLFAYFSSTFIILIFFYICISPIWSLTDVYCEPPLLLFSLNNFPHMISHFYNITYTKN